MDGDTRTGKRLMGTGSRGRMIEDPIRTGLLFEGGSPWMLAVRAPGREKTGKEGCSGEQDFYPRRACL